MMEFIKFLFFSYISFAIYTIIATFVVVGVLPVIISPFSWLKYKLFGE